MKKPSFKIERELWRKNIDFVIGMDEVGRGAFAGPIVAGAVVFPKTHKTTKRLKFINQINDSKVLKAQMRSKLARLIKRYCLFYAVDEVQIKTINKYGIGYANKMVFRKVVKNILAQIKSANFYLLSDGYRTRYIRKINSHNHKGVINGDAESITIAAASIIAKVHRDSLMKSYSKQFKQYKFSRNKGYGTKSHQEALKRYGLSEIHRTSFKLTKFLSQ